MDEADRYSRRLNLRLCSVPEKGEDDIKTRVEEICRKALAETEATAVICAIDVIHRIGKRQDGRPNTPRPVIITFTSRSTRYALWKGTKKCVNLKNNWLCFKEDLTAADREACSKLWPAIEEARKRGEKAYYVGNRAFVNGKEIRV
ncbi:hypothetical protein XENOCAPTIV_023462 [Xenoophorus captivus]|uniref:Uncharacterized protein n=1 Tax=Xenoophorus captivus TaxID=1517983 RepID=A0ABV0RKE8_9TELE